MEFAVQRFMVGRVGAMAELHLGPLWNIFGPPAKLLLGPRPNRIWDPTHFGARTMSQLGPGTIYIWAPRPNHIPDWDQNHTWAQDQNGLIYFGECVGSVGLN